MDHLNGAGSSSQQRRVGRTRNGHRRAIGRPQVARCATSGPCCGYLYLFPGAHSGGPLKIGTGHGHDVKVHRICRGTSLIGDRHETEVICPNWRTNEGERITAGLCQAHGAIQHPLAGSHAPRKRNGSHTPPRRILTFAGKIRPHNGHCRQRIHHGILRLRRCTGDPFGVDGDQIKGDLGKTTSACH